MPRPRRRARGDKKLTGADAEAAGSVAHSFGRPRTTDRPNPLREICCLPRSAVRRFFTTRCSRFHRLHLQFAGAHERHDSQETCSSLIPNNCKYLVIIDHRAWCRRKRALLVGGKRRERASSIRKIEKFSQMDGQKKWVTLVQSKTSTSSASAIWADLTLGDIVEL